MPSRPSTATIIFSLAFATTATTEVIFLFLRSNLPDSTIYLAASAVGISGALLIVSIFMDVCGCARPHREAPTEVAPTGVARLGSRLFKARSADLGLGAPPPVVRENLELSGSLKANFVNIELSEP